MHPNAAATLPFDVQAEQRFVNDLAMPMTWHSLALAGALDDPEFRSYLFVLQRRWAAPELSSTLARPSALQLLAAFFDVPSKASGDDEWRDNAGPPYRDDLAAAWKSPEMAARAEAAVESVISPHVR